VNIEELAHKDITADSLGVPDTPESPKP
jgi:hypothetical protein